MTRLYLLLLAGVISCQTSSYKEVTKNANEDKELALKPTYHLLQFDKRINKILKEFIDEAKCKDCINEIHVDKVRPNEIIITLKYRVYSTEYLSNTNPLPISTIDGVRIKLYAGLEDVFIGDKTNFDYPVKDSSNAVFKVWSIFVKPDSIKVEKNNCYPFFPGETPKIEIKK